ncbi:MAG: hypothetical protein J0M12_10520 [Deltaproteobacteria bacterium]|nr:hypothetical protein [Deltaproteobacteria bacterium]
MLQGFDSRVSGFTPSLVPTLPYQAQAGVSIVKAVSVAVNPPDGTPCGRLDESLPSGNPYRDTRGVCLDTAAVLTVLDAPLENSTDFFRPPYVSTHKDLYRISDLNTSLIPSLEAPSGISIPSLSQFRELVNRVQLDHFVHWGNGLRPLKNYRTYGMQLGYFGSEGVAGVYGANLSMRNNDIALRLMLNEPISERMPLLVSFVQQGIDIAAMMQWMGQKYSPGGGHGQGRVLPILFAGVLLNSSSITALSQLHSTLMIEGKPVSYPWFGEGGVVRSPITGLALYGEPTCWDFAQTFADYEEEYWTVIGTHTIHRTCADPYALIDGGEMPGAVYQSCCSTGPWVATSLVMQMIPEIEDAYDHPEFHEYTTRWMDYGTSTQFDYCAPAQGLCVGGQNTGAECTSANQASVCGQDEQATWCAPDFSNYGVTFGPNGQGGCIFDTDMSDGFGRFPLREGIGAGGAWSFSSFSSKMRQKYFANGAVIGGM